MYELKTQIKNCLSFGLMFNVYTFEKFVEYNIKWNIQIITYIELKVFYWH